MVSVLYWSFSTISKSGRVLILVVVEDGLGVVGITVGSKPVYTVLILVVVEDGLGGVACKAAR